MKKTTTRVDKLSLSEMRLETAKAKKVNSNKNKRKWYSFFQSNKFLMTVSLLLAMIFWCMMAFTNTEEFPTAIRNVPVTIKIPDAFQKAGLKVFDTQEQTVTVYITGNSLSVHQITKDNLQVETVFSQSINEGGTYLASLSVKKVGYISDVTVERVEPQNILVTLDYSSEKTFGIDTGDVKLPTIDGYYSGTPSASPGSVTISGPKSIVDSISSVGVEAKDLSQATESATFTSGLRFLDANGNKIGEEKLRKLTFSTRSTDVTVPILLRKTLTIQPKFTNLPVGIRENSGRIILTPSSIEVAGTRETLADLSGIELDPIDFTQVNLVNNSISVPLSLPRTVKNLQGIDDVTIDFNLTGFSSRTFSVEHFRTLNVPSGYEAKVTTAALQVTVIGLSDEISALTDGNIIGTVNLSGMRDFVGYTEMPITFSLPGTSYCWISGNHAVNVNVSLRHNDNSSETGEENSSNTVVE